MIERRQLELDGLRLSYLEKGTAAKDVPTVVLLHGLMGCAETFLPLMEAFDEPLHVIALDLPGAGHSERRTDIDASLKFTAKHIARVLDALGLERPIIMGHSHGGAVALRMASLYPEKLRSLALVAPAHPYFEEANPLIRFYLTLPGRLFAYSMPWYPQWVQMLCLRRMAGPQSWDTPERLKPYRENLRTPGTMSHLLKLLSTWHQDMYSLRRALKPHLSTPSLVLWGDCDRAVPVHSAAKLCKHLDVHELHILPGVGHRPAEETAAIVARLVTHWIEQDHAPAADSVRYRPNSSASQPRIAALIPSSLESGD
jgi:pimeloyl-ACP methyl ester carboxylesterase